MEFFKAAVILNQLIKSTNTTLLNDYKTENHQKNQLFIRSNFGKIILHPIEKSNPEFIKQTINEFNSEAFILANLINTHKEDHDISYFIYQGFHKLIDQGLVYIQMVDPYTHSAVGDLQFYSLEGNIFYPIISPNIKESTYEVKKREESTIKCPSVSFSICHHNEERILYDLKRLILKSANNAQKHKNCQYTYHIQINLENNKMSPQCIKAIKTLEQSIQQDLLPEYPNSTFIFTIDND
ncbi:hypothetical protein E9993_16500 [Labilibacter sediminis]|nr:hypothetical protein E9993_16500 [Labilibacter sediminis]